MQKFSISKKCDHGRFELFSCLIHFIFFCRAKPNITEMETNFRSFKLIWVISLYQYLQTKNSSNTPLNLNNNPLCHLYTERCKWNNIFPNFPPTFFNLRIKSMQHGYYLPIFYHLNSNSALLIFWLVWVNHINFQQTFHP